MENIHMNKSWQFYYGDCPDAWDRRYDPKDWQEVTLPHDWSVSLPFSKEYSSGTGYLAGGIGWYRKSFQLPNEYENKRVWIVFDGVYKNSQVWCNGYYLGKRPNGYISFRYDITDCAKFGQEDNLVAVKVDHRDIADSRWFTGSGITRKVYLEGRDQIFIEPDGVFFAAPSVNSHCAEISIQNTITNSTDKEEKIVIRSTLTGADGSITAEFQSSCVLSAGLTQTVVTQGKVKNPRLWSVDAPYLYSLTTALSTKDGSRRDDRCDRVGLRSILFDPNDGFFLNGEPMKIKGVCVHHDAGCLGAAVLPKVWKRRLAKLKKMGCNAVRMSHNPHMPELYDLCDEMGFLVMDEAFDEWEGPKNKWAYGHNVYPPVRQGYYEDFTQWHERDLRDMVLRDRNHPSLIMWSVGNEIDYPNDPYGHPLFSSMTGNNDNNKPAAERIYDPNRPNAERIVPIARRLTNIVKRYDSTRPVTAAAAFPELSAQIGFVEPFDVVCYNYKEHLYIQDHKKFTGKAFLGSENSHDYLNWKAVLENDFVCGQFLWTGIDFLGEAYGWPIRGSMAGAMTLSGFEKPLYYFRQSLWTDEPLISVFTKRQGEAALKEGRHMQMRGSWNYVPGEMIEVRCFTNLQKAVLFLNSKSLGQKRWDEETGYISWVVPYEEGCLKAVGFNDRGDELASCSIETVQAACALRIKLWQDDAPLIHNGEDIAQIEVEVTDGHGRRVCGDSSMLYVRVKGPAELIGLENGDQSDLTEYSAPYRRAFDGRLLIYIRSTEEYGEIEVLVEGGGLKPAAIKL